MQMSYRKLKRCGGSWCHGSLGQGNPLDSFGGCQASNFLDPFFPCPPVQSRAREKRVERALNLAAGALKIQGSGPLGLLFISFSQSLEILGWARGCAGIGRGHVFPTVSEMVAVLFLPLKLSTQSVHRDHILPLSLRDSGKMTLRKRFFSLNLTEK